jgi:hypothetical protein
MEKQSLQGVSVRWKADGYTSYQCAWYALGRRATKVFAELAAAKTSAQQKTMELVNGRSAQAEASFRELGRVRRDLPDDLQRRADRLRTVVFHLPPAEQPRFSEALTPGESEGESPTGEELTFGGSQSSGTVAIASR